MRASAQSIETLICFVKRFKIKNCKKLAKNINKNEVIFLLVFSSFT